MAHPRFEENFIEGDSGSRLFLRRAEVEHPAADVLLVHGMGEHSARYFHVAEVLGERGFRVCAFDLRGHGRSGGSRGDLAAYDEFLRDLEHVYRFYRSENVPMFIYGHSLGGQIALHFAATEPARFAGVIIASPWLLLAFEPHPWKLALARFAMRFWPNFTQDTGMRTDQLSRDMDFLLGMTDLDLVHHRMSARMFFMLRNAGQSGVSLGPKLTQPLLFIHGAADPVTSARATEELFHKAAAADKTLKIYPGTLHETHNDTNRDEVLADIAAWLSQHSAGRAGR